MLSHSSVVFSTTKFSVVSLLGEISVQIYQGFKPIHYTLVECHSKLPFKLRVSSDYLQTK